MLTCCAHTDCRQWLMSARESPFRSFSLCVETAIYVEREYLISIAHPVSEQWNGDFYRMHGKTIERAALYNTYMRGDNNATCEHDEMRMGIHISCKMPQCNRIRTPTTLLAGRNGMRAKEKCRQGHIVCLWYTHRYDARRANDCDRACLRPDVNHHQSPFTRSIDATCLVPPPANDAIVLSA